MGMKLTMDTMHTDMGMKLIMGTMHIMDTMLIMDTMHTMDTMLIMDMGMITKVAWQASWAQVTGAGNADSIYLVYLVDS
jgi:hypothetical protein